MVHTRRVKKEIPKLVNSALDDFEKVIIYQEEVYIDL